MNTRLYGCYNKDIDIRLKSSSGGMFYIFAKRVIEQNGIVFGAKFNHKWEVVHDYCENIEELNNFLGSKYVQSIIGTTFIEVKRFLESGKLVLFSGTPCQIGGLKSFLGRDYKSLITIDIICHGVPSPKVWRKYLNNVVNDIKMIKDIQFRNKRTGWLTFSVKITFKEKKSYSELLTEDMFMKGFLKDLYLRPSCHHCAFKGLERCSDITLADYWGVNEHNPELFDNKGTSLILLHSEKGQQLLWQINDEIIYKEVSSEAINYNSAAIESVEEPTKRKLFFEKIENENISILIERLTKEPFGEKIIRKLKASINRMSKF